MATQVGTEITDFDRVATALTVRSICEKIWDEVPADCSVTEARAMIDFPDMPARVVSHDRSTVGFIWFGEPHDSAANAWEVRERLDPTDFLSADTSILDSIDLFCASGNDYFYVLEKNEIIGIVRFKDLYKPLGRLALLALAFEIERLALALCQLPNLREQCWNSLNEKQQKTIKNFYKRKYKKRFGRDPEDMSIGDLIDFTNLEHKGTMIWNCQLVTSPNLQEILRYVKQLQNVRNLCAHHGKESDLAEALPRDYLQNFVESGRKMRDALRRAFLPHLISPITHAL